VPDNAPLPAGISALDRIFSAAEQLFAERGFDSVSINDVAREAGVCKANVFHHFASKQALYETVLTRACEALGEEIERQLSARADPALQVSHFLVWYRDYLRARPSMARASVGRPATGSHVPGSWSMVTVWRSSTVGTATVGPSGSTVPARS